MDKETLPRWIWLLLGLFLAATGAGALNAALLRPMGLPEAYQVVTIISLMAPVMIYVGVWYDEDRRHYWENPRERILGDAIFVITTAALGSSMILTAIVDLGLPAIVQDILSMAAGFMLSWGVFWWRNPDVYV